MVLLKNLLSLKTDENLHLVSTVMRKKLFENLLFVGILKVTREKIRNPMVQNHGPESVSKRHESGSTGTYSPCLTWFLT
jgi:hypothetical protein